VEKVALPALDAEFAAFRNAMLYRPIARYQYF
jgi:hypothetical protein